MKIFVANNPTEAHIVCELLKAERIQCEVRGEGLFGLKGELPFGEDTDPYIWLLNPMQKMLAQSIIDAYHQQSNTEASTLWRCQRCGEENEPQFGACWQCGAPHPTE